jgi:hypothetical protein
MKSTKRIGNHIHVFIETKPKDEKKFLKALDELCKKFAIPFENIEGLRYWTQVEKRYVFEK